MIPRCTGRLLASCAALALAAALPLQARGWKTPPELPADHLPQLCERFPDAPGSGFRLPLDGAEDWPVYRVLREEGEFRVALEPGSARVRVLTVRNDTFRTPEGIGLGSTLKDVRDAGGGDVQCRSGWTCYADLPSGWRAGFSTVRSNPDTGKIEYRDPLDASAVNGLILRGDCAGP